MNAATRKALPNAITMLRLVLAAAFFVILGTVVTRTMDEQRSVMGAVAVGLFILAAVTDAVDGWLARRWQVTSVFGRIMDPFCDKVLVLGAFVYLAGATLAEPMDRPELHPATGVSAWMVVVILARELLVTSVRGVVEAEGHSFGADWFGKAKMILQSFTIPVCLAVATRASMLDSSIWRGARDALVWATVAVTAASVLPYLLRARRLLGRPS